MVEPAPRGDHLFRAARAMEREIAAHRRAIGLLEASARVFERQGDHAHAEVVRRRAEATRELLEQALLEQRDWSNAVGWAGEASTGSSQ